jgi:hypothetical protein
VVSVLDGFPSLFRKGKNPSVRTGQVTFTLHARYAGRRADDPDPVKSEREGESRPLEPELLSALLSYITNRAVQEHERRTASLARLLTLIGVAIAAIASVLAAVISAAS